MGQRGKPPTPSAVLKMRGSWRGDRNSDEPQPEPGIAKSPFKLDREAKKIWKFLTLQFDNIGMLAKVDCIALARYCQYFSDWKRYTIFLERKGETEEVYGKNKDGDQYLKGIFPRPEVRFRDEREKQLTKLEGCFGLNPSARSRMVFKSDRKKDQDTGIEDLIDIG